MNDILDRDERGDEADIAESQSFTCQICHGPATLRSGVSKSTGNPYKGIFCDDNRDHKPEFL